VAGADDDRIVNRILPARHVSDPWSKTEKPWDEESTETLQKKPLKNGFEVLYRSLT
jgi:hypothetical protein